MKIRLPGGILYKAFVRNYKRQVLNPTKTNKKNLWNAIDVYFLGGYLTNLFFKSLLPTEEQGLTEHYFPKVGQFLYHLTSENVLSNIKKDGLIAVGKLKYVYLTDDVDYMVRTGFLHYKVRQNQKDTRFVLIKVDACRLASEFDIFCVNAEHEFAVKKVPVEFLEEYR